MKTIYSDKSHFIKTLLIIMATAFVVSCASVNNGQGKITEAQKAEQIRDSVDERTLLVEFNYVNPMSMPPHHLTSTYSVRIKGDSIYSYLPYFGRAYRSNPANDDRSPLTFNNTITDIKTKKGKKDDYTISFKTRFDSELFEYMLNIYPNGQAYLTVNSADREVISFNGEVVL